MANPKAQNSLGALPDGRPYGGNAATLIADALVNYVDDGSANDLDTDAKRIAATIATNTKLNAILDILEGQGFMKDA